MTALHVSLVGRKDLSGEIYRQVRRAILDRQLRPGDRLPPSRELARALAVARATVTVAYERLAAEGFVAVPAGGRDIRQRTGGAGRARQGNASIQRRAAAAPDLAIDRASDRVREAGTVRLSHRALRRFAVSRQGMATGSDSGAAFEHDDRRRLRASAGHRDLRDGDRPAHRHLSGRRGFGRRRHHHERYAAGARSSGTRPAGAGRRDCRRRSGLRTPETVVQDVGNSRARRPGGSRGAGR